MNILTGSFSFHTKRKNFDKIYTFRQTLSLSPAASFHIEFPIENVSGITSGIPVEISG